MTLIWQCISQRGFSSCSINFRSWKLITSRRVTRVPEYRVGDPKPLYIPRKRPEYPIYPYGESHVFKQSNKGLYGGSFIQFGNSISESKQKTRRTWLPNIVHKSLWSETLNKNVRLKLTSKVLKTISREGGLDRYLTKYKSARIKELGPFGWKLRYLILRRREQLDKSKENLLDSKTTEMNLDGQKFSISCGRRKLLKFLFPLEKAEAQADGETLDYKLFVTRFGSIPTEEILRQLHKRHFDLNSIATGQPYDIETVQQT